MKIPSNNKGQALVLVTIGLVAMCGIMGLAVDLGCTFFVKRWAQSAADAAAMAAAQKALDDVGQTATFSCASGQIACQTTPAPCNGPLNLLTGCQYAAQHGFAVGGHGIQGGANQNVTIAADVTTPAPTAPGVNVTYWVTVRANATVPQIFSAVLGNGIGNASARSTAAVVSALVPGQYVGTNRQGDGVGFQKGNDLRTRSGGSLTSGGPIILASNASNAGQGTNVFSPMTFLRGPSSTADWCAPSTCATNLPDASMFHDPMSGKGQPPAPTPTPKAVLGGSLFAGPPIPSGAYYATDVNGLPTGRPITLVGNVTFQDGAFGNWVIYGGLAGSGTVTFGPGRYILAGVSGSNPIMDLGNVVDNTPVGSVTTASELTPPNDAGEIFVLTDHNYPGLQMPSDFTRTSPAVWDGLGTGSGEVRSNGIAIHGLNPDSSAVPSDLKPFAPVVIWQDQANSSVKYNPDGTIDTSCGGIDSPCTTGRNGDLTLENRNAAYMWGTVYQPRGAGMLFNRRNGKLLASQLITGFTSLRNSATIGLANTGTGVRRRIVALIE